MNVIIIIIIIMGHIMIINAIIIMWPSDDGEGRGDLPITLAMFAFLLSSDPRRALRASMDARCAARVRSPMGARDSSLPRGLTWLYRT